jgi:hypothetical protein
MILLVVVLTGCSQSAQESTSPDPGTLPESAPTESEPIDETTPVRYEIPVVLLFNGEPVEDVDAELLRATFDGEVVTIRWHPGRTRRGYDGTADDVLEFGLPTLYEILGDDYSDYTADFIGSVYAWQGSGGKNIMHAAIARFERIEDLILVKLVFENPIEPDGAVVLGKKPLAPYMPWFTPPWRISYGDEFVITIRIR